MRLGFPSSRDLEERNPRGRARILGRLEMDRERSREVKREREREGERFLFGEDELRPRKTIAHVGEPPPVGRDF